MSIIGNPIRLSEEDQNLRLILAKEGSQRSYDDILLLKSMISKMEFWKHTFAALHPRQVDELCRSLGLETFGMSQIVFNQGDFGDKLYVVLTGSCQVRVRTVLESNTGESEVREKVMFTCGPGQHFGERALEFNEPRAATIVTTAFTELLTVTKNVCELLWNAIIIFERH